MLNNILKNKWVYTVIVVLIISLLFLIFYTDKNENTGTEIQVNQQASAAQSKEALDSQENTESNSYEEVEKGYYMVKEENGMVKVFWCAGNHQSVYKETEIAFSLLSVEDQQLLKDGVNLSSEEELSSFLENFDS